MVLRRRWGKEESTYETIHVNCGKCHIRHRNKVLEGRADRTTLMMWGRGVVAGWWHRGWHLSWALEDERRREIQEGRQRHQHGQCLHEAHSVSEAVCLRHWINVCWMNQWTHEWIKNLFTSFVFSSFVLSNNLKFFFLSAIDRTVSFPHSPPIPRLKPYPHEVRSWG